MIRPTMIYGRGGDQNVSRLTRTTAKTRIPVVMGGGGHFVQPVHVDDIVALVLQHLDLDIAPDVYPAGGAEAIPARELLEMITELLGVRVPPVTVPKAVLGVAAKIAPVVGLRADQVLRLTEDKVVDNTITEAAFGWTPQPLAHRVEQAVAEAVELDASKPVLVS